MIVNKRSVEMDVNVRTHIQDRDPFRGLSGHKETTFIP